MKIKLHMDMVKFKEKPNDTEVGGIRKRLQENGKPVEVTVKEFAKLMGEGCSTILGEMDEMSNSGWRKQSAVMLDFDNKTVPIITIENVLEICKKHNLHPVFYYFTYTHTTDIPRFRLCFIMKEPITDTKVRERVMNTLINIFPEADKSCTDAARIFYGTNKEVVICNENARISLDNILKLSKKTITVDFSKVDTKLDRLISEFDLLGYLIKRNGEYKDCGKTVKFKNCEICKNHDNLVYFKESNSFFCYSPDGNKGGTIIDYLMYTESLKLSVAIEKFKYELCGIEMDWQTPIPFDEIKLPTFPIECLPLILKDYVLAVAENSQTSVEMSAVAALAVIAVTLQGKFQIKHKNNFCEPLNLYILIIAKSGERKSSVIRAMTKIIYQHEKDVNQMRQNDIDRDEIQLNVLRKQIDALEKKGRVEEAYQLRKKYRELEKKRVYPLRLIADDVTSEAMTSLMAENGGRLAIVSTEGGLFDTLAGRYSNTASIDTLLKAYTNDSIRVDRKGRSTEIIDKPVLTILLSAQENVLEGLLDNEIFKSRGLTGRILYSKPISKIGSRKFDTPEIPAECEEKYNRLLLDLLNIPYVYDMPSLRLGEKAHTLLCQFFDWLEPQLIDELGDTAGWCEKFIGTTSRIAGIIHCIEYRKSAAETVISEKTMKRAIKIARYFLEHAKYVYTLMGADKVLSEAKHIIKRLQKQEKKELTKYQIFHLCRGKFIKADDTLPALDLLVEYGYLQIRINYMPTGGRPKGNTYILNPLYFNK